MGPGQSRRRRRARLGRGVGALGRVGALVLDRPPAADGQGERGEQPRATPRSAGRRARWGRAGRRARAAPATTKAKVPAVAVSTDGGHRLGHGPAGGVGERQPGGAADRAQREGDDEPAEGVPAARAASLDQAGLTRPARRPRELDAEPRQEERHQQGRRRRRPRSTRPARSLLTPPPSAPPAACCAAGRRSSSGRRRRGPA